MNNSTSPRVARHRGLSLLELTVVIATMLALLSVLFAGARGWKRGSDRASCIINLRNTQLAVRSYQNMYGYEFGGRPYAANGTQDINVHLFEKGYIGFTCLLQTKGEAPCPGGGAYHTPFPEFFPPQGVLYTSCSHAHSHDHHPTGASDW